MILYKLVENEPLLCKSMKSINMLLKYEKGIISWGRNSLSQEI